MTDIHAPPVVGRDGSLDAFFGDRRCRFRLDIGAIRRLEDARKCGVFALYKRLIAGDCYGDDLVEILRQGLIGGGLQPVEASRLVHAYGPGAGFGLTASYELAVQVLSAVMLVPEKEPALGKAEAGAEPTASSSPTSTEPAPLSASRPTRSTA